MLFVYQSIILAAHIHHASHMVIKKHYKVDNWEHEGTKSLSVSLSCSLSRAALVFWDWVISLVGVSLRYISPEHFLSSLSSIPLNLRPQLPSYIHICIDIIIITQATPSLSLVTICIWFVNQNKFIWKIMCVPHQLPVSFVLLVYTPPACLLYSVTVLYHILYCILY